MIRLVRLRARALGLGLLLAGAAAAACKGREGAAAPPIDAAAALRPRPAEVAHLTLKVLGMT